MDFPANERASMESRWRWESSLETGFQINGEYSAKNWEAGVLPLNY